MKKSKKKAPAKKKVEPKKVIVDKKKPTKVEAVKTFYEVPYVPRKIDRVPPPKNKKWENY